MSIVLFSDGSICSKIKVTYQLNKIKRKGDIAH